MDEVEPSSEPSGGISIGTRFHPPGISTVVCEVHGIKAKGPSGYFATCMRPNGESYENRFTREDIHPGLIKESPIQPPG